MAFHRGQGLDCKYWQSRPASRLSSASRLQAAATIAGRVLIELNSGGKSATLSNLMPLTARPDLVEKEESQ